MRYFAMLDGRQAGPFTLQELEAAGVGPETYVWCKGMDDWQQAGEVADICRYFRQTLHDRMHPASQPSPQAEDTPRPDALDDIPLRWRHAVYKSGEPAQMLPEPEPDLGRAPRSWIGESILAMLLCCPLTGLVALFFGIRSRSLWHQGHADEAHAASARARLWVLISIVAGCFLAALAIKSRIG